MSLPTKAVDRIFHRLAATYGSEFMNRYAGVDEADMKTVWAHELSGFAGDLPLIAWALENLPERCPNVIEFRNICRRAPRAEVPQIEAKADPERVKAELAKLADMKPKAVGFDGKGWAKRIIASHEAGYRITPIALRFAREALRIQPEQSHDAS